MTNETSGILMNRFIMILMKHRIHTLGDLTILLFMITRTVQKQKKERYEYISNLILNINVMFLFWPQIELKQKQFQHYCIEIYFNFGTLFVVHISINVVVVDWPKQDTPTPLFQIFLDCYVTRNCFWRLLLRSN